MGSAILRNLISAGYTNIVVKTRAEVDLRDQRAVNKFIAEEHPEYIFMAAAKVGGIQYNAIAPGDFISDNLMIQTNIMNAAAKNNTKKLLFLGSSCIYPKITEQPIKENQLLTSPLESSNEAYAIAKIAGLKMCYYLNKQYGKNFISCMPTNLYGQGDNFDPNNGHVIPALLNKFLSNSEEVVCWGDGSAYREFLYIDDMADACVFLMNNYNDIEHINVGTGQDITIKELVYTIADILNYKGKIVWDTTKPNGTPRKVLNTEKINNLGWKAKTNLREGLIKTIDWYKGTR